MEYYVVRKDELSHHGILGMHWGVRRFQDKSGRLTAAGKQRVDKGKSRKTGPLGEDRSLTKEERRYIDKYVAPKQNKRMEKRMKNRSIETLSDAPKLDKPSDPSVDNKITNPGWPDAPGRSYNCVQCTTALVMRQKGYDVKARDLPDNGGWSSCVVHPEMFKGAETRYMASNSTPEDLKNTLAAQGPGAYGEIGVYWTMGGGHSMFYKVDEKGNPKIYDGQSGDEYDVDDPYLMAWVDTTNMQYTRLDNCQPTDKVLAMVEPRDEEEKKKGEKKHKEVEKQKRKEAVENFVSGIKKKVSDVISDGKKTVKKARDFIGKYISQLAD